jgi:hypothetical protein
MLRIAGNYMWFFWHFFSIPLLLKTFFYPWKRLDEEKKKGFGISKTFERFTVNTLMRIVGMLIRTVTIALGLLTLVSAFIAGLVGFMLWTVLPFVVILFFVNGLLLII